MLRPCLSNFRAQFPAEAFGVCQGDPKVATYCNEAQDRLLIDPQCPDEGWLGGWITMRLTVANTNGSAYVTTPREISRLVVMGVCQEPIPMRNGFYEYLQFGAGLQPKTCAPRCGSTFAAYDRDSVVTLHDFLSTPQQVRIHISDNRDIGRRVLLQGMDANGLAVTNTDPNTGTTALGEYIVLAAPFVNSANIYSSITGIQKDQTWGSLQFFQVDPTTLVEVALSTMEPNEQTALYRRYLINGIPTTTNPCCSTTGSIQITAQGRLDFVPVINEVDYLTIPCVPALIEEAQSIRFSRMDSTAAAQQAMVHHGKALALLFGQLDAFQGKTSTAVKVPIFGSNRLRPSFR